MHIKLLSQEDYIPKGDITIRKKTANSCYAHCHEFYELELILDGSGAYEIDGKIYEIKRGSVFFMSPASFHTIKINKTVRLINLMFKTGIPDMHILYSIFANAAHRYLSLSDEEIHFFELLCDEMILHTDSDLYVKSLLNSILGKITLLLSENSSTYRCSPIQEAILYIQNNFKNPLKLSDAAEAVHLSPNYLSGLFRSYTGITFKTYLNNLRFDHAEKLLLYTDIPVTEICLECGFNDYSHFISAFGKRYGKSPAHFRKDQKKNASVFSQR